MRLLFVRHGKSQANATKIVGTPSTPLAEEGIEQARRVGEVLKTQNVTAIVCSPYVRAKQTADIIAEEVGIPIRNITVIDDLHERRMGSLEGQPKIHPTEYFFNNDTDNDFESQQDLIDRLQLALEKITDIADKTTGATIVVGHATAGFYFLQLAKGRRSHAEFDPFTQMGNAEYIEVELS